ncbi:MAG: methyltransferase domain-containing protein [Deltaproteobacteria bacterium]|nr:methyltransferase domain-containing protein [Deltaproteobacteria bacterium]
MDEPTRDSWNVATRNHNAHKGDQAQRLRDGVEILHQEEIALLGDIAGKDLVHLQCNAGQDTLCLARRGARCLGVDFSDEAIAFAKKLSEDAGIPARFELAEVVGWLHATEERFDVVFTSYGTTGWLRDLDAWARGVARVLRPGGVFVYVEFHPLVWSIGDDLRLSRDDYFQESPFTDPVGDYVAESGSGLGVVAVGETVANPHVATSWQHGFAEVLQSLIGAGLALDHVAEYPHSNGCRLLPSLVLGEDRRYHWPDGVARVPLMFSVRAKKPAAGPG